MESDFHYCGTYALARMAGLRIDAARTVATAAEYTDEAMSSDASEHSDGGMFVAEDTAHRKVDLWENNNPADQRRVWVPFHFLPGGEGNELSEKLVCQKDSAIAREMVQHALGMSDRPFALELMGITAHVYADTFAHYGFSGVSSRRNRVGRSSIEVFDDPGFTGTLDRFFGTFGEQGGMFANFRSSVMGASAAAATGALGHCAVATCPDQPYLTWSYEYEVPELVGKGRVDRTNMHAFLAGSRKLYEMFREFVRRRPEAGSPGPEFELGIESAVRAALMTKSDVKGRSAAWDSALSSGRLRADLKEHIPAYQGPAWDADRAALVRLPASREATNKPVFRFYQAAAVHRDYVLRELLPAHGIVIG